MRVLYVRNGITAHDRRFLDAIVNQGHVPIVVELGGGGAAPSGGDLRLARITAEPGALRAIALDNAVDIAHVGPIPTLGCVAAANLPPQLPLVVVSWGSDILRDCDDHAVREQALRAIDRANAILVDCESVRQRILDWRPAIETPFCCFPWGIDLRRYSESYSEEAAALREDLGWAGNVVFISTRSWEPAYGIDILLAAFALVAERDDEARLLLIGDGSLRPQILGEIARRGLARRVHIPGRIEESRLPLWYAAANLYVSSSPCDGTSVSLLEAMASRLPAIVHERFGNTEWIRPRQNGWLADCRDPLSLGAAMSDALQQRERWAAMGQANRARTIADADWAKRSLLLTDAYRMAIHGTV
jgi:glycosyltransferase involved in cell wall biosynthesis